MGMGFPYYEMESPDSPGKTHYIILFCTSLCWTYLMSLSRGIFLLSTVLLSEDYINFMLLFTGVDQVLHVRLKSTGGGGGGETTYIFYQHTNRNMFNNGAIKLKLKVTGAIRQHGTKWAPRPYITSGI